jgi:hypothetical protein
MTGEPKHNGPKVTSARDWRRLREEGVVVQLPSGFCPRLRPVGIEELVRRGRIPDELGPLAAETVWMGQPSAEQVRSASKGALDFLNIVVQAAFLEPRVTLEDPGDDEISIDDVDLGDKQFVFMWVTAPAAALRKFRDEQARNVDPVHARDEDRAAAQ